METDNVMETTQTQPTLLYDKVPLVKGLLLMLLSWLIPGAGFFAIGHRIRGIAIFALIQAPFLVGVLLLPGSVLPPVWSPGDHGANIVNGLTFVTQLGNGLLSGIWLLGSGVDQWLAAGASSEFLSKMADLFKGDMPHALYELASFYLLVSGGLNYFCVCNFYDRHINPHSGPHPHPHPISSPEKAEPTA